MNRFKADRKIRKRLETGPVPEPPANLLEKIQRDIPVYLAEGEESDPAGGRDRGGRPAHRLLAASLATAIAGGALAYLVMDRTVAPGEADSPASLARSSRDQGAPGEARSGGAASTDTSDPTPASPALPSQTARADDDRPPAPEAATPAETAATPGLTRAAATAPPAAPAPAPSRLSSLAERKENEVSKAAPAQVPLGDREVGKDERSKSQAAFEDRSGVAVEERAASNERQASAALGSAELRKLSAPGGAATDLAEEPDAAASSFRAAEVESSGRERRPATARAKADSYRQARAALRAGRLPAPETIEVEAFAAAFAAGASGDTSGPLAAMAAEFAEILRRTDAARAGDLRALLARLEAPADGAVLGRGAGELAALARRALELIEAAAPVPDG